MDKDARYLRVTIHDNDFRSSLMCVGRLLQDMFWCCERYPTEEEFPELQEIIMHIWHRTDQLTDMLENHGHRLSNATYFKPDLKFVLYSEIPDWDNSESIYIPMFDDAEILTR